METNPTQLKRIKSGAFRSQYLVYGRKSTDDGENQKNSLDHQRKETLAFAEAKHLRIAPVTVEGVCTEGVISESHSGFKEDAGFTFTRGGEIKYRITRPKFNQLVRWLNDGCFAGLLCMSWDRLSRNKPDNAIITKLLRQGIDIQFVTATYDDTSAGALHMDIDGMFAQHHSRVTKEKVTGAMHKMRDEGIVVYKAPLGYQNTGKKYQDVRGTDHKPLDPVRAPIVTAIFEKYATGTWSMSDLARWANEQGLTNFPKRRPRTKVEMLSESPADIDPVAAPITCNNIYYILGNRFYTGRMQNSQGDWIPSVSHEAIIDEGVFAKVQALRSKKQVSIRYKKTLGHALRGFVRCAGCGRVYTPYTQKGIQYFGSRCASTCSNSKRSCNLHFIETEMGKRLPELFLDRQELEELDQRTETGVAALQAKLCKEGEQAARRHRKMREDLTYLREHRLELLRSGVYSPADYITEAARLQAQLSDAQAQETITQSAVHETLNDAIKLSELLNALAQHYENAHSSEKEEIMRCLFSELSMDDKTFDYSLKNGFRALTKSSVVSSAPDTWLSELLSSREDIKVAVANVQAVTALH